MKKGINLTHILNKHGADILSSDGMKKEKSIKQHRTTTTFDHSIGVVYFSLLIAKYFRLKVSEKELVRGALLHDYFLYDWHDPDPSHRLHGFSHAKTALKNAEKDFELTDIERDIIVKHMFPLNIKAPSCKESAVVCIADKICAICEMMNVKYHHY